MKKKTHVNEVRPSTLNDSCVKLSSNVQNLGAISDNKMKLTNHVNTVCQKARNPMRNISKITKYLSQRTKKIIAHALDITRFDYLYSLLHGNPSIITRLQRLSNAAARIVTNPGLYDHITDAMKQLHWLPVESCIQYKVLVLVHACVNNAAPPYLSNLISNHVPSREIDRLAN